MTSRFPFACLLALAALLPPATLARPTPPRFAPETVFAGHSEGHGTLRLGIGKARPFRVSSAGTASNGHVRLHQEVKFEGQAATARDWELSASGPDHYTGTLSDAAGPVDAHVDGRRLTLRYPLNRRGLAMHQTLDLGFDGRTIDNRATVRFLGVPVGWLHETIVRLP